ncbi:MAG: VWA domain-containing protein [Verrucomicrobia bacterium]|nr:VWA domain-containing protein [Verrucomicrobiota bacterium]
MFQFGNPSSFILLFAVALAAWCMYARRIQQGVRFAPMARIPRRGRSWRTRLARALPILILAGLTLLVLAMARPQTVLSKSRKTADVIAVQMVVDISGSMEALDMSTRTPTGMKYKTRLDTVKEAFADFVEQREDDLIGLIAFGGYVSTLAPMTSDHDALRHVLEGVATPKPAFDKDGNVMNEDELLTAIGDALATACARIETAEPVSRIIVLLSDGESNTGMIKPERAIEVAKGLGIKVYSIGVGSTGNAPFWATDRFGRKVISRAHVTLDERLLRRIATETGGVYFNVKDEKGLERALEEINTLETTRVEQDVYRQYRELFIYFMTPGLALVLLGLTLNMAITRRLL